MCLTLKQRIEAFAELGNQLGFVAEALNSNGSGFNLKLDSAKAMLIKAKDSWKENPWFTPENVRLSILSLSRMLKIGNLEKWLSLYPQISETPSNGQQTIGVIMAGNLPLVGFHDFLCTSIAGYQFAGKLSSKDSDLPVALASILIEIEPKFTEKISFAPELPPNCIAVIATGSDNSARYFEHAFGNKPHLFRKNRNSVAMLTGMETNQELELLGNDIFSYFGLGCRNVSKLYVPKGYDINCLKKHWKKYSNLTNHKGYNNNLTYNKAIMIAGQVPFVDLGFCSLKYDVDLASPISVIHVEEYDSMEVCQKSLLAQTEKIQCIIGNFNYDKFQTIPFGNSQSPDLWDYADGVDTMGFLLEMAGGRRENND